MNKDVKTFLKDIKLLFPVFSREEKTFFKNLKTQIFKENPNITYDKCVEIYGEPTEIISEYYEGIDTHLMIKKIKKQHFFKKIFIIILCLAFFTFCFKNYLIYKDYKDSEDARIEIEETEIEYLE